MPPSPFFTAGNTTSRYELRFHFGWYTSRRKPLFADESTSNLIKQTLEDVAQRNELHLLESEIEPTVMRVLLSLRPETAPSAVTRSVKGNIATQVRQRLGIKKLWSRGWFTRSNGHVTNEAVRQYIASQYEHLVAAPIDEPEKVLMAGWHNPADACQIRTSAHAAFEYNVHVVLVTRRRFDFLDLEVAEHLVQYFRRVCDKKQWQLWEIEIVWNHVHLFLGLNPTDAADGVALSLMNNSAWMLHDRYAAAIKMDAMTGIWQPSYYVGTTGSATTSQVKAFLERKRLED